MERSHLNAKLYVEGIGVEGRKYRRSKYLYNITIRVRTGKRGKKAYTKHIRGTADTNNMVRNVEANFPGDTIKFIYAW